MGATNQSNHDVIVGLEGQLTDIHMQEDVLCSFIDRRCKIHCMAFHFSLTEKELLGACSSAYSAVKIENLRAEILKGVMHKLEQT